MSHLKLFAAVACVSLFLGDMASAHPWRHRVVYGPVVYPYAPVVVAPAPVMAVPPVQMYPSPVYAPAPQFLPPAYGVIRPHGRVRMGYVAPAPGVIFVP